MAPALAGYPYFLDVAASVQWDDAALDLTADALAWPHLPPDDLDAVLRLVAGFCVAEASVAAELQPFGLAAADPRAAACFRAQAVDEARHARFFDRVAAEVTQVPGAGPAERRAVLRRLVPRPFLELFEDRLPAMARDLAGGTQDLQAAVGLYHMVLEGVVLIAGQFALLDLLDRVAALPGVRRGVELVHRDERWHIGFGARCLQDLQVSPDAAARILAEGEAAAQAWGEAVGADHTTRIATLHRRRLRAVGLIRRERRARQLPTDGGDAEEGVP
jgi:ribonucleoside-diphosphate reductase beta chain